jgi:large subunit ribosomal protein L24
MAKIKRNDQVIVIAGKDKGKKGRVLRIIVAKNRVLVEGVGMIKKHVKPNPQANIAGGILQQEAPIHISNVALVDSEGKKTRVGFQIEGDKKTRIARSNGGAIVESKALKTAKK